MYNARIVRFLRTRNHRLLCGRRPCSSPQKWPTGFTAPAAHHPLAHLPVLAPVPVVGHGQPVPCHHLPKTCVDAIPHTYGRAAERHQGIGACTDKGPSSRSVQNTGAVQNVRIITQTEVDYFRTICPLRHDPKRLPGTAISGPSAIRRPKPSHGFCTHANVNSRPTTGVDSVP